MPPCRIFLKKNIVQIVEIWFFLLNRGNTYQVISAFFIFHCFLSFLQGLLYKQVYATCVACWKWSFPPFHRWSGLHLTCASPFPIWPWAPINKMNKVLQQELLTLSVTLSKGLLLFCMVGFQPVILDREVVHWSR